MLGIMSAEIAAWTIVFEAWSTWWTSLAIFTAFLWLAAAF
jgi:hypothetical protein